MSTKGSNSFTAVSEDGRYFQIRAYTLTESVGGGGHDSVTGVEMPKELRTSDGYHISYGGDGVYRVAELDIDVRKV